MTWNLTLDILLVVLILLFGPIGFMRGPIKELLVALGIAFGALLVEFWARPWGRDLDFYFDLGDDPGAFVVAMAFLMATTFIGGYGIGLILGAWDYALPGRILGGVVAMLNGTLLVAFSLQYVRLFLLSDANEESLEDSLVIRGLLDGMGWILLVAAIAVVPILLFALITNRRVYAFPAYEDEYGYDMHDEYDDEYEYDEDDYPDYETAVTNRRSEASAETRVLPPRVPGAPEESGGSPYKSEPEPAPIRPHAATRPLEVRVEEGAREHFAPEEEPSSVPVSLGDTDPEMAVVRPESNPNEDVPPEPEPEPEEPLAPGYRRCENCNAVLPPDSEQCPVCGHIN